MGLRNSKKSSQKERLTTIISRTLLGKAAFLGVGVQDEIDLALLNGGSLTRRQYDQHGKMGGPYSAMDLLLQNGSKEVLTHVLQQVKTSKVYGEMKYRPLYPKNTSTKRGLRRFSGRCLLKKVKDWFSGGKGMKYSSATSHPTSLKGVIRSGGAVCTKQTFYPV